LGLGGIFDGFIGGEDDRGDDRGMAFSRAFVAALLGETVANLARGTPNPAFGRGVSGPDTGVGVGGGPGDFLIGSTMVQKALAAPVAPVAPVKLPVIPAPAPQRKRFGRQETILTSGLSEATTFKPTLLGQ
jgi:hypothetical protein